MLSALYYRCRAHASWPTWRSTIPKLDIVCELNCLEAWQKLLAGQQVLGSGQLGHLVVDFAVHMVRACAIVEPVLAAADLFATLETLVKISYSLPAQAGLQLQQLVVEARRAKCAPCCTLCPPGLACTLVHIAVSHMGSAFSAAANEISVLAEASSRVTTSVFSAKQLFVRDSCDVSV